MVFSAVYTRCSLVQRPKTRARTKTGDVPELLIVPGGEFDQLVDDELHLALADDLDELTQANGRHVSISCIHTLRDARGAPLDRLVLNLGYLVLDKREDLSEDLVLHGLIA